MLEKLGQTFRRFVLVLIFVLALTLLVSALSILLSVLTLAVLAILVALITSPQETKRFFSQASNLLKKAVSWSKAFCSKRRLVQSRIPTVKTAKKYYGSLSLLRDRCNRSDSTLIFNLLLSVRLWIVWGMEIFSALKHSRIFFSIPGRKTEVSSSWPFQIT